MLNPLCHTADLYSDLKLTVLFLLLAMSTPFVVPVVVSLKLLIFYSNLLRVLDF